MENQMAYRPLIDQADLTVIDNYLELLYESRKTLDAGQEMADTGLKNSQVHKLENIVVSSRRFSEIINFIKNQTGKDKDQQWTKIAETLLSQLDEIEEKAKEIGKNDHSKIIEVKKQIARGWVKQIVAHYLFAKQIKGGNNI